MASHTPVEEGFQPILLLWKIIAGTRGSSLDDRLGYGLSKADAFDREKGWSRYEDLNWSPSWRANFSFLARYRRNLYIHWVLTKTIYHPVSMIRSALNVLTGRYELKSEMALRRIVRSYKIGLDNALRYGDRRKQHDAALDVRR